ncbi:unnamed protein product [Cercopithifilaria johnstoni]|uniref:Secreted protein n=1 Tax=Cercopithifilaria johnstoni TaxID=2874296 RepID=A0A8J2MH50_9BILA|nr:unnamed protein product [Cercopithifilaria johnstoni]
MYLPYYLVLFVLPLYVAQITVSNDQRIQEGIENEGKIKIMANNSEANKKQYRCKQSEEAQIDARKRTAIQMSRVHCSIQRFQQSEETQIDARKRTAIQMLHVQ